MKKKIPCFAITKEFISMKALIIVKSLLTSLCQREAIYPSMKRGLRCLFPSLAKRGRGDFLKKCLLNYELISISLLLIITGCGGGGGEKTSSSGFSPVTLTAKFITSTDMKAAASTIANIHYTVTGPGMKRMEGTVPVTGNLVEFKLNVPNGKKRFFRLTAVNSSSHILYGGATYQDLNGTPVTVDINLKNPIAGKWGFVDFGRDIDSWETKAGRIVFRTDGSMTISTYYHNDGGYISSKTEDFRYTVGLNSDGSTNLMVVRSDGETAQVPFVLSDDGNTLFFDETQNITDQKIFVAGRMDPANNYTNADLKGDYYGIGYEHNVNPVAPPNGNGGYMAISSIETFDGIGSFNYYGKANSDGVIWDDTSNSPRNYSVNPDGFFSVSRDGNVQGAGGIGIDRRGALAAPVTPDKWGFYFFMKKGDRTYSTADFEGTWAITGFGDDNNTNFQSAFGTGTCDSKGNCTFNFKERDSSGNLSDKSKSITVSVSPDGSFGQSDPDSPLSPPYAGAIGNNGNTFILNPSFGPASDGNTFNNNRTIIIGVRSSGFPAQTQSGQDQGWIKNPANGHFYKLTDSMNWLEAEAQAVQWGGHLATINDANENEWLVSTFGGSSENFWIGYTDKDVEGVWKWISGEDSTYTNWFHHASGALEPTDTSPGEDAVAINYINSYCVSCSGACCSPQGCIKGCTQEPCQEDGIEYAPGKWNDLPISISKTLRGIVEKL